jgi:hypothetical protein
MIWGEIMHHGKTNRITTNGTPNSKPYCEGIGVPEIKPFLSQGQITYF